jgi:hypothetical protein
MPWPSRVGLGDAELPVRIPASDAVAWGNSFVECVWRSSPVGSAPGPHRRHCAGHLQLSWNRLGPSGRRRRPRPRRLASLQLVQPAERTSRKMPFDFMPIGAFSTLFVRTAAVPDPVSPPHPLAWVRTRPLPVETPTTDWGSPLPHRFPSKSPTSSHRQAFHIIHQHPNRLYQAQYGQSQRLATRLSPLLVWVVPLFGGVSGRLAGQFLDDHW